jgi:beta-lactamase superfamily II metal-dependent hydrolase
VIIGGWSPADIIAHQLAGEDMLARVKNSILAASLLAVWLGVSASAARTLDIYFLDAEGGQSTLIVTPTGESLLVDTGFQVDGRDPKRIVAAAKDAGITQIDYLLITHLHADHLGGAPELSRLLPIKTFIDYGELVPTTDAGLLDPFKAYAAVRANGQHIVAKAGGNIPLKGVDVQIVSSSGTTITAPLTGGGERNALCEAAARPAREATENPRSNGIVLRYGKFSFVDLGDLTGTPLFSLFCPNNLLGQVDVLLVPHHGGADVASPAAFATRPRVAIMNNGHVKGGSAETFATLHKMVGTTRLQDVWQVDKTTTADAQNFGDTQIANLDASTGHWIKVSANEDGTFIVTNGRTGQTRAYKSR